VKICRDFFCTVGSLQTGPWDIMFSFDGVSHFASMPIREAVHLRSRHFDEDILRLQLVPTPSYFSFSIWFYKQAASVAMGIPLPLVIAIFCVEDSEEIALNWAAHKPVCWFQYTEKNIIWYYGPEKQKGFLDHMNTVHQNVLFVMETGQYGHISFLGIDIYRRPNGSRPITVAVRSKE
jgi:hypothetical protein